jgi:hypothetical protein
MRTRRSTLGFFTVAAFLAAFLSHPAKAAQTAEWTLLIYLNGNNSLDSFGPINLEQAETVGSTPQVNVVAEWASLANGDTRRLLVTKSKDPTKVTSPILQNLGKIDMGDYKTLEDFVQWGVTNFPAKHYMIDVWDHGSGWHAFRGSPLKPMDISWDDNTGHSISTEQLGEALSYAAGVIGHKVDVYASDACLMAMAEVASEMGDSVSVYAGSQDLEPGAGWPYGDFLLAWTANPTAAPADVAGMLVKTYVKSYQGGSNGTDNVTFSAYNLDALSKLTDAVKSLGLAIQKLSKTEKAKVTQAITSSVSFTYPDYIDFGDLLGNLQQASVSTLDTNMVTSLQNAMSSFVITNGQNNETKASGLSIWAPSDQATYSKWADKYAGLKFEAETQWSEALKYLVQ